jgi:hypothetical protein
MNYEVPNLYDNLNLSTLPKIIIDEFYKIGSWLYTDEEIFIKPFFRTYYFDNDNEKIKFYLNENAEYRIQDFIKKEKILNENFDFLTYDEFKIDYIKEFGRGFYKGYVNFSNELKNKENQIFETDNKQIAHKIFSKAIKKKNFIIARNFPLSFIPFKVDEQIKQKFNNIFEYSYINKKIYNKNGFETGEEYKAWETILHNPTIFEDIFIEQFGIVEKEISTKEEAQTETPDLKLKNIPNFNLPQRYYLFQKLGFDTTISKIKTDKQGSRNKILALLMGISVDNAKHSTNGSYKQKLTSNDLEEIEDFLYRNNIEL